MSEPEVQAHHPEDEEPRERNRTLLLAIGALVIVSAVIAGVVIFSGGGSTRAPKDPVAKVRISGQSLLVGDRDAGSSVVVEEDFGSPASREFELASRDFLRVEAAQGKVLVTYRPIRASGTYGRESLDAWAAAVDTGNTGKALVLHDRLFDRQPAAATPSTGASREPVVVLDGRRLVAGSPTAVSDELQRSLLGGGGS